MLKLVLVFEMDSMYANCQILRFDQRAARFFVCLFFQFFHTECFFFSKVISP